MDNEDEDDLKNERGAEERTSYEKLGCLDNFKDVNIAGLSSTEIFIKSLSNLIFNNENLKAILTDDHDKLNFICGVIQSEKIPNIQYKNSLAFLLAAMYYYDNKMRIGGIPKNQINSLIALAMAGSVKNIFADVIRYIKLIENLNPSVYVS
jgi:hypothetical protein